MKMSLLLKVLSDDAAEGFWVGNIYRGTLFYITHHTAAEDVTAVHRIDIHMGSLYGVIESATEESAAE